MSKVRKVQEQPERPLTLEEVLAKHNVQVEATGNGYKATSNKEKKNNA